MAEGKIISDLTQNPSLDGTEEKPVEKAGLNYKQSLNNEKDFILNDLYGYLPTYDVTDLQIDKNYVLLDYTLSSDITLGFDILTAKIARCVYFVLDADGVSRVSFNDSSVGNITGVSNGEVLTAGKYTFVAIFNNTKVDLSVASVTETVIPLPIPDDGLEVFFDFINQSTLTIDSGLITNANNLASPAYFANQSTTGFKPTFDAVEGAVFNGIDDFFSSNVPTSLMTITGDYTMFMVYRNYTPVSANDISCLYENASGTTDYHAAYLRQGTLRQGIYESGGGGVGFVSESIETSEDDRHVTYFTNQNKVVDLEQDGLINTGTETIYTAAGVAGSLQLGAAGGTKNYFHKGSIEKIIIYNKILSAGEKTQVLNYLNS